MTSLFHHHLIEKTGEKTKQNDIAIFFFMASYFGLFYKQTQGPDPIPKSDNFIHKINENGRVL